MIVNLYDLMSQAASKQSLLAGSEQQLATSLLLYTIRYRSLCIVLRPQSMFSSYLAGVWQQH